MPVPTAGITSGSGTAHATLTVMQNGQQVHSDWYTRALAQTDAARANSIAHGMGSRDDKRKELMRQDPYAALLAEPTTVSFELTDDPPWLDAHWKVRIQTNPPAGAEHLGVHLEEHTYTVRALGDDLLAVVIMDEVLLEPSPITHRLAPHLIKTIAAVRKARTILFEKLNDAQRLELALYGRFTVVGGATGTRYWILRRAKHNVMQLDGSGRPQFEYCWNATENVPADDRMLAQKLFIEGDEPAFLKEANAHPFRPLEGLVPSVRDEGQHDPFGQQRARNMSTQVVQMSQRNVGAGGSRFG